jgi:hypothetical protein
MMSQRPATLAASETPGASWRAAITMAARPGSLGLDQNVRGDHVTPTQPASTI